MLLKPSIYRKMQKLLLNKSESSRRRRSESRSSSKSNKLQQAENNSSEDSDEYSQIDTLCDSLIKDIDCTPVQRTTWTPSEPKKCTEDITPIPFEDNDSEINMMVFDVINDIHSNSYDSHK